MSSDLDAVRRIVEAFERSDWQEIDVRSGDVRVHLAATTPQRTSATAPVAPAASGCGSAPSAIEVEERPAEAPTAARVSVPPGTHLVTSASPGIFWRAPEPGAPPFTDIGQSVEPASTLCIIEVMKLMNHLKAGVSGDVAVIYVEDGVAVAKDEPLFAIVTERPAP